MLNLSLKNKQAIVCGSTQGIGLASAMALASQGARICLLARNEASLKKACTQIDAINNDKNTYLAVDFSTPEALKLAVESHLKEIGMVHILVNNTGGPPAGLIKDASIESFYNAYDMHLACSHILMQAVLIGMQKESYGRIINIISTSVKIPLKGLGVSNTTRGAVASWAKTLSNELAQDNITVNNVLPGATNTARLKGIIDNKAKKLGKSKEEVAASMLSEIPMKRFGEAEEVAALVAFLASPSAGYITGTSTAVDGGRTGTIL